LYYKLLYNFCYIVTTSTPLSNNPTKFDPNLHGEVSVDDSVVVMKISTLKLYLLGLSPRNRS